MDIYVKYIAEQNGMTIIILMSIYLIKLLLEKLKPFRINLSINYGNKSGQTKRRKQRKKPQKNK